MNSKPSLRCSALTKAGNPCPAPATATGRCFFHENPEKATELGRRGGMKNRHVRPHEQDVELPPLNTAEDVRSMLAKAAQDVRNRRIDPRVATSPASSRRPCSRRSRSPISKSAWPPWKEDQMDLRKRVEKLEKARSSADPQPAAPSQRFEIH